MLNVSRAMFEEPDVIFISDTRVDNREREARGYPTSTASNNGWGYVPLSHSMRCSAVCRYIPIFSPPNSCVPQRPTVALSGLLTLDGRHYSIRETRPRYVIHSHLSIQLTNACKSDFVATRHWV